MRKFLLPLIVLTLATSADASELWWRTGPTAMTLAEGESLIGYYATEGCEAELQKKASAPVLGESSEAVPEPSSLLLLTFGLAALALRRR